MSDAVVKVRIEGIVAGGAGLAKIDGKSVLIEGTAPSEIVVCRVFGERRSWAQAELLEIVEASPERAQPACGFYGACGGCNLQHLSYPAQLAAKTAILKDALARIGGVAAPEPDVVPSEPWEYRNWMQFHAIRRFDKSRPDAFFGLKARKSAEVIPVADCPIADPGIRALLRGGGAQAKALLVSPGKDRATIYSRDGLLLSEAGTSRGKTRILGKELALDAGAFFQSNGAMLEKLAADLREIACGLGSKERGMPAADLFCGVGALAAFFGEFFPGASLVEENKSALAIARENLAHLAPVSFHAERAEIWAKTSGLRGYGFVVADPPRQGLDPRLARGLAANGPRVFAYVSCDPATLARDSKALMAAYDLAELRLYDFYPQTAHIEALAVFARRNEH